MFGGMVPEEGDYLSAEEWKEADIVKANSKALVQQLIESGKYAGMNEAEAVEAIKNDLIE